MSRVAKIAVAVAVVLLLPVGAYAVGNLTSPVEQPAPPREIEITEAPTPTPTARPDKNRGDDQEPRNGDRRDRDDHQGDNREDRDDGDDGDDDVRIVTPRPAPVDDDDDDDDRDGHDGGGDDHRDDGDDDD